MTRRGLALVALAALILTGGPAAGQSVSSATNTYQSRMAVSPAPGDYEVINLIIDFPPGSATEPHTHGGQGVLTVLEGEVTLLKQGAAAQTFRAGENFIEPAGVPLVVRNAGSLKARVSAVFFLPKGTAISSRAAPLAESGPAAPTPANSGAAGGAPQSLPVSGRGGPTAERTGPEIALAGLLLLLAGAGAGWRLARRNLHK